MSTYRICANGQTHVTYIHADKHTAIRLVHIFGCLHHVLSDVIDDFTKLNGSVPIMYMLPAFQQYYFQMGGGTVGHHK